jgi:cytochrome c-type biogenesis protein CcmH/NrfG
MSASGENLFERAIARYRQGTPATDLLDDFQAITTQAPRQASGWICLAWLQLLSDQHQEALRSARTAVRLSPQDPQARVNLSLALLETRSSGVRDQIAMVQRLLTMAPELGEDLRESLEDGLSRRPGWPALTKVKTWLGL